MDGRMENLEKTGNVQSERRRPKYKIKNKVKKKHARFCATHCRRPSSSPKSPATSFLGKKTSSIAFDIAIDNKFEILFFLSPEGDCLALEIQIYLLSAGQQEQHVQVECLPPPFPKKKKKKNPQSAGRPLRCGRKRSKGIKRAGEKKRKEKQMPLSKMQISGTSQRKKKK